jgi:hypothetical protein
MKINWALASALTLVTTVVSAQASAVNIPALVEALRLAAPQTGTANDGLYTDWQIKPENIPRWSRLCINEELTPAQFEADTAKARQVLACVMEDIVNQEYPNSGNDQAIAVRRAAAWWMTGDPDQYNQGETATYTQKVLEFYQQQ